jgi:sorting nexin-29
MVIANKFFEAMKEFKIPKKLMRLARATFKHVKCRVKMQNNLSEPFGTLTGIRVGDALSCILFNLALEKVIRDSGIETKGTIYNKTIQILAYADDIVSVGRNIGVLKEEIKNLSNTAKEMGLTINLQKTKYMEVTKKPTNLRMLEVDDQEFERAREFKYLGSTLTEDNNITTEIKLRILMANRDSYGLKKQLSSRYQGRQTKCTLYNTCKAHTYLWK